MSMQKDQENVDGQNSLLDTNWNTLQETGTSLAAVAKRGM